MKGIATAEKVAAWMFVTAARNTTYGSWDFDWREDVVPMYGDRSVCELIDAVYEVGDPWLLSAEVYGGGITLTVSDHYTEDGDPSADGYEAAWRRVEELEGSL